MKYRIEIKESARAGAAEAFLYYEEQQSGLGHRFLDKLELLLHQIAKHPKHYHEKYKHFRQALVKPFPYLIIFEIEEAAIVVYKVINAARKPSKRYK